MGTFRRRLITQALALFIVVAGGTLGYWYIGHGHWELGDCLYMTMITITTVGYGEVLPDMDHTPYARTFTVGLLVFGTGVLVYFASTITAFIVDGELKRVLVMQRLGRRIRKMKDHIVVCGAGSTGRHIIEELIKIEVPVVAVDMNEQELQEISLRFPKARYTYMIGDATDDDVLLKCNLSEARGLVAALSQDKDNLYLTVAARQAGPQLRIIARCAEIGHVEKIKRAGADGVVSPNFIGGMRMVSELMRPQVVRFLDDMIRDKRAAYRVEEVTVGAALVGKTIREADVRGRWGMNVIAARAADADNWIYNPEPDLTLSNGMVVVVVGSTEQVRKMREDAA